MKPWRERLMGDLEPILLERDPAPKLGAYHDLPYAVFIYPPDAEFELRKEVSGLSRRLENAGKRVTRISLAECMERALDPRTPIPALAAQEKKVGLEPVVATIQGVLADSHALSNAVVASLPSARDQHRDVVFITRAGALFRMYEMSALLDELQGRLDVPGILFYPGHIDGPVGLSFMSELPPKHDYRVKIF